MPRRPAALFLIPLFGLSALCGDLTGLMPPSAALATPTPPESVPGKPGGDMLSPVDSPNFLVGLQAARQDDHETAARSLAAALAADPHDMALLRQAFLQNALAGTPDAVSLARESASHPGGRTIISAFVLGNAALMKQQWQEAAAAYASMPMDSLTRLLDPLLQAWCLAGEGKTDAAVRLLTNPARASSPMMPFYVIHAGLIASVGGKKPLADQLYRQAATLLPGQDMLFARARANALWQAGHDTEARAILRQLTSSDTPLALAAPDLQAAIASPPVTSARAGIAHAYVMVAYILRQQSARMGQADAMQQIDSAAGMMLRMALSLEPHLAIARLMLTEVEEDADHKDVALAVLNGIEPNDPLSRVARYRKAVLENAQGNAAGALRDLKALAHDQPDSVLLARTEAMLSFEQKDWAGSIAAYNRAIAATQASHTTDWTLLFGRAAAYERAGDWARAEADIQAARKLVPDEPLVLNFLGYGWIQRGLKQEEATNLLRRAVSLDPDDAAIRDSLGWALIENGDLKDGTASLEQAAEQSPLDPEVNYHLGVAYWRSGRKTEAVDQWNVALGLKPEPDDLQRIQKALANAGVPLPSNTPPGPGRALAQDLPPRAR